MSALPPESGHLRNRVTIVQVDISAVACGFCRKDGRGVSAVEFAGAVSLPFKVGEPQMTTNTLALVTTDGQATKFNIIVVSWVQNKTNRYIEISATNSSLGQRLVRIISPKTVEAQRRLSEFHDKLLSAAGKLNMQVTAYTDKATIPANTVEIDLTKQLVYLIAPA